MPNVKISELPVASTLAGTALLPVVQSGITQQTTLSDARMKQISVLDYGADPTGVSDSSTAFQTALNLMAPSTNATGNPAIYVPRGTYKVSATLSPVNSASNFRIYGEGRDSTVITWSGSAGIPMFQFVNPRNIWMDDLSLYGKSTAKPSSMVNYHRAAGGTIGAGTGHGGLRRVRIGDGTGDHTKGVLTSADAGQDTNNEEWVFEDCQIIGSATYAYHFSHSNSLLNKLVRGTCESYGTAAISNDCSGTSNASFYVFGTAFSGASNSVIFEIANPLVAPEIHAAFHENGTALNTKILSCPTAFASKLLRFFGGWFNMADPTTTSTVVWNGDASSTLEFHGTTFFSGTGVTYNFAGAGRVNFFGGTSTTNTLTFNGETTLYNLKEGAGAPTYTVGGAGSLRLIRSSGSSQFNAPTAITAGATPTVSGLAVDEILVLNYAIGVNLTSLLNGRVGQVVTLFANNGNATIVHATGTDNPFLNGGINFVMATGNSLTLRRLGAAQNGVWAEIGRKV